jgi:hypothetical protein
VSRCVYDSITGTAYLVGHTRKRQQSVYALDLKTRRLRYVNKGVVDNLMVHR